MNEPYEPDDFDVDCTDDDASCGCAVMRATVLRDGRVSMTSWMPGLAEGGPSSIHFRGRERAAVAIADLRLVRSGDGTREVIVEFMAAGRARESAEAAICEWARAAGYQRVWLPSGPVDIQPVGPLATASVRCRVCRARWTDSTPTFWEQVHRTGHFPLLCPICAHTLPQWDVAPGDATRCRGE